MKQLKSVKMAHCSIETFAESTRDIFFAERNYWYYTNFTPEDSAYYERIFSKKARTQGKAHKHFVLWVLGFKPIMEKYAFTHEDLTKFHTDINGKKAIWHGKPTAAFEEWRFSRPQTSITKFL